MAQSSAHALLHLINEILDFSKIEAGKLELERVSFSLRECIGEMLKLLGIRADKKGLELTADIAADVPDHLIGDPTRLRQILINLTDNAIKFTDSGDVMLRVTVESQTDDATCLHFTVSDTGVGISPEKQSAIFEAFAQADGSTTRHYGGTGLGLAIVSQIVQHMSGRIWVESTKGAGSTFHFTVQLPVRDTPAPDVRQADTRELEGLRVLVVDDHPVNRRILQEMLTHWRMQPVVVASGAAALTEMHAAAHAGTPFPLVILDGMMPEMDGFMVAEKIRGHRELSGATVMMLSSAMPTGAAARCGELGVASYLLKPVSQSELRDAILIALGSARLETGSSSSSPVSLVEVPSARSLRNNDTKMAKTDGLRILIAEDNATNRAVISGILKKRGHVLTLAANGCEAVQAAAHGMFDVIIMDVQMPEMDGFEATRHIRGTEIEMSRHTPIVAMTAHAMAGDRERCLAAGMDHYLSKPVQQDALISLLELIGETSPNILANPASGIPSPSLTPTEIKNSLRLDGEAPLPILTRKELLDYFGDDETLQEIVVLFQKQTPPLFERIRAAVATSNGDDLARCAHTLVGSLGAFGAKEAICLTRQIEALALEQNYQNLDRCFALLEHEMDRIDLALRELTATPV